MQDFLGRYDPLCESGLFQQMKLYLINHPPAHIGHSEHAFWIGQKRHILIPLARSSPCVHAPHHTRVLFSHRSSPPHVTPHGFILSEQHVTGEVKHKACEVNVISESNMLRQSVAASKCLLWRAAELWARLKRAALHYPKRQSSLKSLQHAVETCNLLQNSTWIAT